MALSLQIGFPNVPKSITNKDVDAKDAFDVSFPMSFLQFIKIITVTFEPDSIQLYYNHYIKLWNNQNSQKDVTSESIIVEKYRDFLQDIVIHYTTLEEKKFLSSIDFNDPLDLDIALGFYSKKLKELCLFYNEKRNNIKFSATRNKIIGTNFGASKTIHDLTLSYLKTLEDSKILLNFEDISQKLNVEIEELYDNYPIYYNQLPNERIYDNKDLDYGLDIFLKSDEDLVNEVFSGFSDTLKNIKEVDLLFENKRKLTKKYVSTDFYYLSTGSTVTDNIR
jgi:hypothetical protein